MDPERRRVLVNVAFVLKLYAKQNAGWSVAAGNPGTKLRRGPDTLRCPDAAMVQRARVPAGKGAAAWLDGAPDLVVEITGNGRSASQLMRKAADYLRAGAQIVWVVEVEARNVIVLTPPDLVRVLTSNETLDGGTLMPGFACRVAEIFE